MSILNVCSPFRTRPPSQFIAVFFLNKRSCSRATMLTCYQIHDSKYFSDIHSGPKHLKNTVPLAHMTNVCTPFVWFISRFHTHKIMFNVWLSCFTADVYNVQTHKKNDTKKHSHTQPHIHTTSRTHMHTGFRVISYSPKSTVNIFVLLRVF